MKTFLAWFLGIGTLAGALLIWWSKRNAANTFQSALEVQRLKELAAKNAATAEQLTRDADATARQVADAEEAVEEAQRAILHIASELPPGKIYEMSHDEIAKALSDVGL